MRLASIQALLLVFAFLMSGCVTEVKSNFTEKYDPVKAVTDSVAAAIAYMQEGRYQDAHRHLRRAHGFNPKSPHVLNAYALLYGVEGDRKREEEYYRRAVRADGSFSKARNNYAVFLFAQGRYQEAVQQLSVVVEDVSYGRRYVSFENLGRCYLKLGQREEAREAFFRSVRLNSKYHQSWLSLVEMSLDDKDYKAARSQLTSYERVGPTTLNSLDFGRTIAERTQDQAMLRSYEQKISDFKNRDTVQENAEELDDADTT